MTEITRNVIKANGIDLHYREAGEGPAMILLHGWPQTSYSWRKVICPLSERYRVIAPDLRGMGDSDKPVGGYDMRTVATDIRQLAAVLRELHALPLTGRTFDAIGAARDYAGRIRHADPDKVRDCVQAIEAVPLPHKASLRLGSKTRAGLEYTHEETIRENRAKHEVRDERLRLNLTSRALPHTNLRVAYEFLHRGGSDLDTQRDRDLYADPRFPGSARGPARGLVDFAQFDLAYHTLPQGEIFFSTAQLYPRPSIRLALLSHFGSTFTKSFR